ncbi:ionotropic receptor 25a-like [Brevipalpus obovatus]|uniref:ionotropic receptor 25a-like n=1 Tax=Brevipalpus obovatus TaxID=246614 RepID=UPI003D9E646E
MVDHYSPYSMRYVKDKIDDDDRVFTLKESLWFRFTSLTPQGGGEGPRALSGRLVTATWWLFGFIVVASYTANLAAFLTVSRLDRNIQTFDDLTIQYKVRYSPVEGTATARHFEMLAMNEERFYEVWKDLSLNDSMTDEERARLAV